MRKNVTVTSALTLAPRGAPVAPSSPEGTSTATTGTPAPLIAAVARMEWLPTTMPGSPLSIELFALLLIAPMFVWDLYRLRQVQRAYVIWFIPYLLVAVMVHTTLPW